MIMLSLDTAVGGAACDLFDGPGLQSLWHIVEAGIVAGSLSGPLWDMECCPTSPTATGVFGTMA